MKTYPVVIRNEDGTCYKSELSPERFSQLTYTGEDTTLRGWGECDGVALEYTSGSKSRVLIPEALAQKLSDPSFYAEISKAFYGGKLV